MNIFATVGIDFESTSFRSISRIFSILSLDYSPFTEILIHQKIAPKNIPNSNDERV